MLWLALCCLVGPSASLIAATSSCSGSTCQMNCTETSLCATGGCFHDGKDKCEDYPDSSGWTTTWTQGPTFRCDKLFDANQNVIGVTCRGTDGEAAGDSCTCNYLYTNGVKHCG